MAFSFRVRTEHARVYTVHRAQAPSTCATPRIPASRRFQRVRGWPAHSVRGIGARRAPARPRRAAMRRTECGAHLSLAAIEARPGERTSRRWPAHSVRGIGARRAPARPAGPRCAARSATPTFRSQRVTRSRVNARAEGGPRTPCAGSAPAGRRRGRAGPRCAARSAAPTFRTAGRGCSKAPGSTRARHPPRLWRCAPALPLR